MLGLGEKLKLRFLPFPPNLVVPRLGMKFPKPKTGHRGPTKSSTHKSPLAFLGNFPPY